MDFSGAKLALFLGDRLLVIRRDDRADILFPDHWDLPGGGREQDETPQECALRETREEVGLTLSVDDLVWSREHHRPGQGRVWFFAAHMPANRVNQIVFGSEGQGWALMSPQDYCGHAMAIPHFAAQISSYMTDLPGGGHTQR